MADPNKNPLNVARYEDLTNSEMVGILMATRKDLTNQHNEAMRILQVCLDLEHFISTLDLDPAKLTDDQREEVLDLRNQVLQTTGQFVQLNILGEVGGTQTVNNLIHATSKPKAE